MLYKLQLFFYTVEGASREYLLQKEICNKLQIFMHTSGEGG